MSLLKSASTIGGMTLISRIFGFFRDILIASRLGTGPVADAFFIAFRFPNLFRTIFAEGAFNSAFIPLFAGKLTKDGQASAKDFAEHILAFLLLVLLIFTSIMQIFMPWMMVLLAPGFHGNADQFDL